MIKKLLLPIVFLASNNSLATPFNAYEARSMAMGDTHVALARRSIAPLFNPAMLNISHNKDDYEFSMTIPNTNRHSIANRDALSSFETIANDGYLNNIGELIRQINSSSTIQNRQETAKELSKRSKSFAKDLSSISNKPLQTNEGWFASVAVSNEDLPLAIFTNETSTMEALPIISDCDQKIMQAYSKTANEVAYSPTATATNKIICNRPIYINGAIGGGPFLDPKMYNFLTSKVAAISIKIKEVGITAAKPFNIKDQNFSFGITLKYQKVTSMFIATALTELDDEKYDLNGELKDRKRSDDTFNMDFGTAASFFDGSLTAGLTIKNIFKKSYETAPQNGQTLSYEIKPQARAGIAWNSPVGLTVAADLDLTKNEAYFVAADTQYLGLGLEWDIFNSLLLRAGTRSNIEDSDDTAFTAGLGFNIFAFNIDLAGQISENNAGVTTQISFVF